MEWQPPYLQIQQQQPLLPTLAMPWRPSARYPWHNREGNLPWRYTKMAFSLSMPRTKSFPFCQVRSNTWSCFPNPKIVAPRRWVNRPEEETWCCSRLQTTTRLCPSTTRPCDKCVFKWQENHHPMQMKQHGWIYFGRLCRLTNIKLPLWRIQNSRPQGQAMVCIHSNLTTKEPPVPQQPACPMSSAIMESKMVSCFLWNRVSYFSSMLLTLCFIGMVSLSLTHTHIHTYIYSRCL